MTRFTLGRIISLVSIVGMEFFDQSQKDDKIQLIEGQNEYKNFFVIWKNWFVLETKHHTIIYKQQK